jgi:uncharacterized damage-inducible protein DinB
MEENFMSYTFEDVLGGVRDSRAHFLKHINGITAEQWVWKPYPESKSIAETVAHLITDDRMALYSLETGKEPEYDTAQVAERDPKLLLEMLAESHTALVNYMESHFSNSPLDTMVSAWGFEMKLGKAAGYLSSEDYYHAGQSAFIRTATDPGWNYYAAIYGA